MAKKIIDRYIWLIETVAKAGEDGISYKDINKRWMRTKASNGDKYPLRTFHNHRNEISEVFNIDIVCNNVFNTYYIDINKLRRRHSKANKLLLSFLADITAGSETVEDQEDVVKSHVAQEKDIEEKLPIEHSDNKSKTPIEWDENPIEIQLQVYDPMKTEMISNPIHHSQIEISSTASSIIVSLTVNPVDSFKQALMYFGEHAEILSPNSLRKDISDMFGKAMKRYTSTTKPSKKKKDDNEGIIQLW